MSPPNNNNDNDNNNNNSDHEDPLNIVPLARNFDILIDNIQSQSSKLAQQVHNHVSDRKKLSDISLTQLNEKLNHLNNLIKNCNSLNDQIDMLQQLQILSKDFNQRLTSLNNELKRKKNMPN